MVTPFTQEGEVDYAALRSLIDYQLANGADFFCILATTGETPTLTPMERHRIKDTVVEVVNGRVPILMGCGGNDTASVVRELKEGDFFGIDGVLSVCPYYNKPSQEGLYQHFKTIAASTHLPVVLYNVPGRTGVNMRADTTVRLAHDCHNIVGIKEASGLMPQVDDVGREACQHLCRCLAADASAAVVVLLEELGVVERPVFGDGVAHKHHLRELAAGDDAFVVGPIAFEATPIPLCEA